MWPNVRSTRYERHFQDRVVRCFTERPANLYRLLDEALARHPDGEAMVYEQCRVSYRALHDAVERLAANLSAGGLGKGDRLAILLANRPEFLYAVLAAARLGAIAVPVNIREQTPALEYVLKHCQAKVLLHEAVLAERLPRPVALPDLQQRYALAGEAPGSLPFEALLEPATGAEPAAVDEEDTAVILYTSGTTGRPKGAMLTHLNLIHSVMHFESCMELSVKDRSMLAVPASHVTGLVAILLAMLRAGGCTVMMANFKARAFLELAARERLSHTILVPAMYNLCLLEPDFADFDLSAWRVGGYGGAPMPQATIARLAQRLPGLELVNAYGATETTSPVTLMPAGQTAAHSDSVGCVLPCAEVRVMDEQGREVAPGESGELWIHGPMVVPGFWNDPQATAQSFVAGHWRSGDIGSIDREGYVRIFDRKKDLINRGGYKIYSVEVENVLSYHPAVIECAAVARPDPVLGEKVQVFLRCREGGARIEELKRFCAERLADYKVPEFFFFSNEPLPRNANGKVVKTQLREQAGLDGIYGNQ